MIKVKSNHIDGVGPRSAHIAGLKYSCYADPEDLRTGEIIFVKPKENDIDEYVAIKCENGTYAITNTCAANALEMIEKGTFGICTTCGELISKERLEEVPHTTKCFNCKTQAD